MRTQTKLNSWISCPKPNPQAQHRLFCFPCPGGTTAAYSQWHKYLPQDIEINLVQLPGRGYLREEAPFTKFLPLVKTLASKLKPYLNKPFIFFGHSMGATLAFEITRQLRRETHPIPTHLFAAGCPAPQKPIKNFLFCLPANFTMIKTYKYKTEPPLDCPITVFGALQDRGISLDNLENWRVETNNNFNLEMFTGDRFFLQNPQGTFLDLFSLKLSEISA